MKQVNSSIYEVYYQDSSEHEPEKDIVFSLAEAEEAVLDFYNDCIQKYLSGEQVEPLDSYEEVPLLHEQYARQLKGKAWFVAVPDESERLDYQEPAAVKVLKNRLDAMDEDASQSPEQPAPKVNVFADTLDINFFTHLTANLKAGLSHKKVDLSDSEIHQIVSYALWNEVTEEADPLQSEAQMSRYEAVSPEVLLILVKDDDAAVYFGDEYIDAADQKHDDDLQIIIDTAQMLAEKYQTQVHTHHFSDMPAGWSWSSIEIILKACGLMTSEKPNLLMLLQNIESLRLSINAQAVVTGFQFHQDALEAYLQLGDKSQVVFSMDVEQVFEGDRIDLTVEEVVKAVEVHANHWVCGDFMATELIINPRKYFNTSFYNLLR